MAGRPAAVFSLAAVTGQPVPPSRRSACQSSSPRLAWVVEPQPSRVCGCRGRCVGLTLSNLKGSEVGGNAVLVVIFWFGACAWRRDSFASFAVPRRAGVAGREGSGGARGTAADKASKTMPSHLP